VALPQGIIYTVFKIYARSIFSNFILLRIFSKKWCVPSDKCAFQEYIIFVKLMEKRVMENG
jgi:hypothetical protein